MRTILIIVVIALAVASAVALARPREPAGDRRAPAATSPTRSNQTPMDENRSGTNSAPTAEHPVNWDEIVRDAQARYRTLVVGGISFRIPASMHQQTVDRSEVLTFPNDLAEGPWIRLGVTDLDPQEAVAEIKMRLSQFERVVDDKTVALGLLSWRVIRRTTDFGIDETTWIVRGSRTVVVTYTEGTARAVEVFQDILRSATRE